MYKITYTLNTGHVLGFCTVESWSEVTDTLTRLFQGPAVTHTMIPHDYALVFDAMGSAEVSLINKPVAVNE